MMEWQVLLLEVGRGGTAAAGFHRRVSSAGGQMIIYIFNYGILILNVRINKTNSVTKVIIRNHLCRAGLSWFKPIRRLRSVRL